jgi:hypothetical protein
MRRLGFYARRPMPRRLAVSPERAAIAGRNTLPDEEKSAVVDEWSCYISIGVAVSRWGRIDRHVPF